MFGEIRIDDPLKIGSYDENDVVFLLKDIGSIINEKDTGEREIMIQKGIHYSEMLPTEYPVTPKYYHLFELSMKRYATQLALYVGILAELLINKKSEDLTLVSLARAGTPIGVLLKRYFEDIYQRNIPHYSISIIIGKGIDHNALKYILSKHSADSIQFVDGWTGKGTIRKVLEESCEKFSKMYGISLNATLAVIADPCGCAEFYGTRSDFMLPNSLLNSTISGLISRTIHRDDLIGTNEFHGVKFYREYMNEDVSKIFVDNISNEFHNISSLAKTRAEVITNEGTSLSWNGTKDVEKIMRDFQIDNVNFIKPSIGETTRVLLRRLPWKILIKDQEDCDLLHILELAKEKGVPVEKYDMMAYRSCGLIKNVGDKNEDICI